MLAMVGRPLRSPGRACGCMIGAFSPCPEGSSTMSDLPTSVLGRTGATVTKLAYGAMELRGRVPGRGGREGSPAQAKTSLNNVLDSGINMIDTSPEYGASEALIGE